MTSEQLSLHGEKGWGHDERLPVPLKPELQIAWRGLLITISAGTMSRAEAIAMLRSWDADSGS